MLGQERVEPDECLTVRVAPDKPHRHPSGQTGTSWLGLYEILPACQPVSPGFSGFDRTDAVKASGIVQGG